MSFGRDTKSRWSLLFGVYARGSKISHTGGKYVTCSGLTHSRWTPLREPRPVSERKRKKETVLSNRIVVCVIVDDVLVIVLVLSRTRTGKNRSEVVAIVFDYIGVIIGR